MEQEEAVDNPGSESDEHNEKQSKGSLQKKKIVWKFSTPRLPPPHPPPRCGKYPTIKNILEIIF